jgi:TATA-binding protein-associated factor
LEFSLQIPKDDLASAAEKFFSSWLKLASTATGSPLEASTMFSPTTLPRKSHVRAAAKLRASKGEGSASRYDDHHQNTEIRNADSSFSGIGKVVVGSDTEKSVVQMRVSTAFALGVMASSLPLSLHNMLVEILSNYLTSPSGVQRQVLLSLL